jgi:hypothetical protein
MGTRSHPYHQIISEISYKQPILSRILADMVADTEPIVRLASSTWWDWAPMPILPLNRCWHRYQISSLPSDCNGNQLLTTDTIKDFSQYGRRYQADCKVGIIDSMGSGTNANLTIESVSASVPDLILTIRSYQKSAINNRYYQGF